MFGSAVLDTAIGLIFVYVIVSLIQLSAATAAIGNLALPIGWANGGFGPTTILGWLITALAASLGAPSWFDLLNKFANIRASGKAPEEEPKSPKEVPVPEAHGG